MTYGTPPDALSRVHDLDVTQFIERCLGRKTDSFSDLDFFDFICVIFPSRRERKEKERVNFGIIKIIIYF
jgi:hypothetical protein